MIGMFTGRPRAVSTSTGRLLPLPCTVSLNLGSLVLLTEGLLFMPEFVLLSLVFVSQEPASVGWL